MNFLGIGPVEILVILAVVLIAFGPNRLPELARHVAKAMKMFREASDELQRQLDMSDWDKDVSKKTSSYSSSYNSYEDPYKDGAGESGYYEDTYNHSETDANASADKAEAAGSEATENANYAGEGDASPEMHSTPESAPPIDDPNKTDDAQRYAREMTD
ncbi:MAG: twin-arginine translocase TatA/TatE family subunit [Candidatus Omnitrophica bacterium]|nr:twin-arginine translocase TatA/TatE family subunit [Candidatus Omnitrophota bacterium]